MRLYSLGQKYTVQNTVSPVFFNVISLDPYKMFYLVNLLNKNNHSLVNVVSVNTVNL